MTQPRPTRIVILGGGTAGYMSACAFVKGFGGDLATVELVESEEIGIVGVGEATLPQVHEFNQFLGLDEREFMRATNATFKVGINFVDWNRKGDSYFHPFGVHGSAINGLPFLQFWQKAQQAGHALNIEDYSYSIMACRHNRFDFPSNDPTSLRSTYSYAYHFDAQLYAKYLRGWAEARGLKRTEGRVVDVMLEPETGHIQSLKLQSGQVVEGDIFIDCSGFVGLLISKSLNMGWDDWTPYLPCDRAVAMPCERAGDFTPYTRATAREAGWTWRIPLQNRTGNGYVFSSQFTDETRATEVLLNAIDGKGLADPRLIRFQAGRRQQSWYKNCVSVGLASGFLEPLESTSIYLAQMAIQNFLKLFHGATLDPILIKEFNRLVDVEYERVRDFLILHYVANSRDGALWDYVRNMPIPDSLQTKIEQFKHRGYVQTYRDGLFSPASWISVYVGQGIRPNAYDPQIDVVPFDAALEEMNILKDRIEANVKAMPSHAEFVKDYCYDPKMSAMEANNA